MQPSRLARRKDSGSVWRHCSVRSRNWGLSKDVISLNAAISACEKGGRWQRVAPLFNAAIAACRKHGQSQILAPMLNETPSIV
eukprot:4068120-Karenia_brevis.AAC.2